MTPNNYLSAVLFAINSLLYKARHVHCEVVIASTLILAPLEIDMKISWEKKSELFCSWSAMEFPKHNLELIVDESANYAQVEVLNTAYWKKRNSLLRRLFFALILQLSYFLTVVEQHLVVHSIFLVILTYTIIRLLSLVDREVLKIVSDFGIEKSTVYAFGRRQQLFVPINNVLKVVINEFIYLVSFLTSFYICC